VAKKIDESLKVTVDSRQSHVGHFFGIPAASSELTSLVCRVQEKPVEEGIRSIHSNSTVKTPKTDQDWDFAAERKKLKQEQHDTKHDLDDEATGADAYSHTCPLACCRDISAFWFTRCSSGFPEEDQCLWLRTSGYFIPREFVRTYYGGSKKRLLVRYFLYFLLSTINYRHSVINSCLIRASQGSSQASATLRLVAQSRCQRSVLACPVTPIYSTLPQRFI
jgi:hypothetical protein